MLANLIQRNWPIFCYILYIYIFVNYTPRIYWQSSPYQFQKRYALWLFLPFSCRDFYTLNVAGVLKLTANQNITLWVKSRGAGTWEISEDSSFSVVLLHVTSDFHSSGFQAALDPLISQSVVGATKWKLIRAWVTTRSNTGNGLFNLGKGPILKYLLRWARGKVETFSAHFVAQPEDQKTQWMSHLTHLAVHTEIK